MTTSTRPWLNPFLSSLPWMGALMICFSGGSLQAQTALPIKNGAAPVNVSANITHSCQAAVTTDDHILKQVNDQRVRLLSSLSNTQRTNFFSALSASTVPGNVTTRRSSVTFDLEATNKIGLAFLENAPDGGIKLQWGTCLHVRVFDGAGALQQITFFSDPNSITAGDRCFMGPAGPDQMYLPLSMATMEGFSVVNREFMGGPGGQIVADSMTLGGNAFPISPAPLPVVGDFLVPMSVVESIAIEDAMADLNGDGVASNTMGFLFADLLAAGSAALPNFAVEIVITGTLNADCQTFMGETNPLFMWSDPSGSGEQGIIDFDTESAFLNYF